MRIIYIFILTIFSAQILIAQNIDEKKLIKSMRATEIIWDTENGDGVFIAQFKSSKKWGMFQLIEGMRYKTLVLPKYDSLGFFSFNGSYTIYKKGNKYGVIGSPWENENEISAVLLPANFDFLKPIYSNGVNMLIAKQNGKWTYIDYKTGKPFIPFIFKTIDELPIPSYYMKKYPMDSIPNALKLIMEDPKAQKEINLSNLGLTFLPKELGECINATSLNLEGNLLGYVPDVISKLANLERLYLGSNAGITYFGKEISSLTKLKSLYIGMKTSYGTTRYTTESLEFDESLSNLKSLENIGIFASFGDDIPEFIYSLSNLKSINLSGIYINQEFSKLDINKLACKNSLQELTINYIGNFENINEYIGQFPNLEYVKISTRGSEVPPTGLINHPNLYYLNIIGYVDTGERYSGSSVLDYDNWKKEKLTTEERKEAIIKWNEYMQKVKNTQEEK